MGGSSGLGWRYPQAVPPSGLIHCCPSGSSVASRADLLHAVLMGCRGTACSSVGLSWAARCYWSASCPPPALILGAAGPLLPRLPAAVAQQALIPSLQSTPPEVHPASLTAQLCPAVGPCGSSWSCSALTWGTVGLCSQRSLLKPSATITLLHTPQCKV